MRTCLFGPGTGTPSSSTRIHFVYGTGSAIPEDQYAVDVSSYQGVNGGVGNDWGAGRLLPNSVTGKLPGVRQSEKCGSSDCGWFNLGPVPSTTSGNNIRITGYGTAAVDSRSQKTHVGALTTIGSDYIRYVPDTTVSGLRYHCGTLLLFFLPPIMLLTLVNSLLYFNVTTGREFRLPRFSRRGRICNWGPHPRWMWCKWRQQYRYKNW